MRLAVVFTEFEVQPHFWCKLDSSWEWQSAGSQQLEFCSPVHLPLESLQAIDSALHRPVAPCMFHCVFHRRPILPQLPDKPADRLKPSAPSFLGPASQT